MWTAYSMCPLFTVYQSSSLIADPLPTIIGFKAPYQQVREEEGMTLICLMRKRNLDRNDTVTVVTLPQMIGEEVFQGIKQHFIATSKAISTHCCIYVCVIIGLVRYIFLSCISTV